MGIQKGFRILGQKRTGAKPSTTTPQKPHSRARVLEQAERAGSKEHLKPKFLAEFEERKTISSACKAAGVSRWTIQDWRKADPEFDRAFVEAEIGVSELIEANAVNFSIAGVPQYATDVAGRLLLKDGKPILVALKHDPKLIQFMTERRIPERYGRQNENTTDLSVAKWLAAKAVEAINTIIPACCPACKTNLQLKDKIAEHLLQLSTTMKAAA